LSKGNIRRDADGTSRTIAWEWIVVWLAFAAVLGATGGAALRILSLRMNTTITQAIRPPFDGRGLVRIIALGEDRSNPGTRGRSDTIIIAAIDLNNKTVRAVSIPRDTHVWFPDRDKYDKINSAYARGGPTASLSAAERVLGVGIDYYIKTSIDGLKDTVDLLGGVEIDIEKDMNYVDRRGGLYIHLRKGYRLLNGNQALEYVRFRHDKLGDISRIQRQQKFLRAIARKALSSGSIARLPRIANEVMSNVETDMSGRDLLALAQMARDVRPEEIEMNTLPGHPENIHGISYWIADEPAVAMMVDRLLRFAPPSTAESRTSSGSQSSL